MSNVLEMPREGKKISEYRARTKLDDKLILHVPGNKLCQAGECDHLAGKCPTDDEYDLLLWRDCKIYKEDGNLLAVYRKNQLPPDLLDASYPALHSLKKFETTNRGMASGTKRFQYAPGLTESGHPKRTYSKPVASAIIGAIDPKPPYDFCRLTSWTGQETAQFQTLFPLFRAIGDSFAREVPDRWRNQMREIGRTKEEWVVPGTPFTTITVNNTYSTGIHTDKGDLHEGFSNLVVLRRGAAFAGGRLVFPQYRVAVDMQEGDILLMDAHEWHGNTPLEIADESSERISIVCYYRTEMKLCGSREEEQRKAEALADKRTGVLAAPDPGGA